MLEDWHGYRFERREIPKSEADAQFVQYAAVQYQQQHQAIYGREFTLSIQALYRRWRAYREKDLDGLLDKRGQSGKGKTTMPRQV